MEYWVEEIYNATTLHQNLQVSLMWHTLYSGLDKIRGKKIPHAMITLGFEIRIFCFFKIAY
jgi:hypothetical protein